jgi:membrane-bound serine protease (ClpP class)
MKQRMLAIVLLSLVMFLCVVPSTYADKDKANSSEQVVYVLKAHQTIESGLYSFLQRGMEEASLAHANHIVLDIDTLGGRVDTAEEIGQLLRGSKIPVTAYIQGKAASAGSYIALNAEHIVMKPGSSIGAAALVTGSGQRVTDSKVVSFWSGVMKSAAELHQRNPEIAEGMVDETVVVSMPEIHRIKQKGQIISLTADEALKVGYSDYTAPTLKSVLEWLNASEAKVVEVKPSLAENIAKWITHPMVMVVLFVLGIAGIAIEMLVPGFGIPGVVGVSSFGLYFFGHYIAGFAGVEEVVFFIIGILLLVSEFFIPSFGILGIIGVVSLISGVVLAAYDTENALYSLGGAFIVATVIVVIFVKYFKHRGIWNKFILRESQHREQGYVPTDSKAYLLHLTGESITPLRPAGTVWLNGERIDVVTEGDFIGAGKPIKVVKVEGTRVLVQEIIDK